MLARLTTALPLALTTPLALQYRFGLGVRIGGKAFNHFLLDLAFDQAFDISEKNMFVDTHQRDRLATGTGATGATDAMHIIFGHIGQLVIHDVRQLIDIDTARRDVSRAQHLQAAALEFSQRPRARALALVAVNGQRSDAVLVQLFGQPVGTVLGAHKHQHLLPLVFLDQIREQFAFTVAIHRVHLLANDLDGGIAACHLDHRRRVEQAVGKRLDLGGKSCREQEVLPALGQERQNALDVADETHVEHAVGFIKYEDLNMREIDRALLLQIEQATRCCDQNINAAFEQNHLRIDAHTAEYHGRRTFRIFTVDAHALFNLRSEFARRCQYQHAHRFASAGGHRAGARRQQLQDGQHEAGGLTGAGLRTGHQIAAGEYRRNRLRLDRRGGGVTVFGNGAYKIGGQAEGFK